MSAAPIMPTPAPRGTTAPRDYVAVPEFASVPIGTVHPSPTNPRKHYDEAQLKELAQSIALKGIIQPLLVRRIAGKGKISDHYEVVAGERRLRAAHIAGQETVPVVIREMTDLQVIEAQVEENMQRADLHPLEEAEAYRQLINAGYTVARIAERVGRSIPYIYDRSRLLDLVPRAQTLFLDGRILAGHAVILSRISAADQERAIDDGLFQNQRLLFRPDDDHLDVMAMPRRRKKGEPAPAGLLGGDGPNAEVPLDELKAVSTRELQAWVDKHTKLEASQADPMLFPETVEAVKAAAEEQVRVVRITYDTITPDEAKDGPRVILGHSWARADGKRGSKTCDSSVLGMVVIGPGRGEAFRVCVAKKTCAVHWPENVKAAKKAAAAAAGGTTSAAKTAADREADRRRKYQEEEAARKAEHARLKAAEPAIIAALLAATKKAPTGAAGPLGRLLLEENADNSFGLAREAQKRLTPGKSADDLVRYLGFGLLLDRLQYSPDQLKKVIGVDVKKILDEAAPKVAPPAKAKAGKKPAKKGRGRA